MAKVQTIVEITEFSDDLRLMPKPGIRAKARIYCQRCCRYHHVHWGSFKNAMNIEKVLANRPHHPAYGMKSATSLQEIIDLYAFQYCDRDPYKDGYEYTSIATSPAP